MDRLTASIDRLTSRLRRRLAPPLRVLFDAGDELGRDALDLAFDPRRLPSEMAAAWRLADPGEGGSLARRELVNKLEVVRLVRGTSDRLGPSAFELGPAVRRALELPPRHALWVLEGLAHAYAQNVLAADPRPEGLLCQDGLPEECLLVLHAGMGMALSEELAAGLEPSSPPDEVGAALALFAERNEANAADGCTDAAVEALGLYLRCFEPGLMDAVAPVLAGDEPLHALFWHGAGRGLYFQPVAFLPGRVSLGATLERAAREAPDELARRRAAAGASYAAVLVNLGDPAIVEGYLTELGDDEEPFREGLASSIRMRRAATPGDSDLAAFLAHRPADPERWRRLVLEPLEEDP